MGTSHFRWWRVAFDGVMMIKTVVAQPTKFPTHNYIRTERVMDIHDNILLTANWHHIYARLTFCRKKNFLSRTLYSASSFWKRTKRKKKYIYVCINLIIIMIMPLYLCNKIIFFVLMVRHAKKRRTNEKKTTKYVKLATSKIEAKKQ